MSFPKAPLKRFNENIGCAPAPGSYDLKIPDGLKGPVSFEKSQRFRAKKDSNSDGQSMDKEEFTSPVRLRKHSSHGSTPNLRQKPEKDSEFLREVKKQKNLEREIRSLLKERAEQDRKLLALEEELRKTDAKLVTAVREKTSLSANIASLERQIADLNRTNELLKTKFSDDSTKKRLGSLSAELMETKSKMDAKDKELICLQATFDEQITLLQNDLACSRVTLDTLREKNVFLEENHLEANMQCEGLQKELDQAQNALEKLTRDHVTIKEHLSMSQEQIKNLCAEMTLKQTECDSKLQVLSEKHMSQEKTEVQLLEAQKNLEHTLQKVTQLEEQIIANSEEKYNLMEEKSETEKKLAATLMDLSDVLAQAEKSKQDADGKEILLNQKEQDEMLQKNLFSQREEELLNQMKELESQYIQQLQAKEKDLVESQAREESLKLELEMNKNMLNEEKVGLNVLQKKEEELISKLQVVEEKSHALRQEMQNVHDEMMRERRLLEDELEGMLDELDSLQQAEERAEKLIVHLEIENKQRVVELAQLEETLNEKTTELEKLKEIHKSEISRLKVAQRNTVLAFESFKISAKTEIESLKSTNVSLLEGIVQEHKEEQQDLQKQLVQLQEEAMKTRESLESRLLEQELSASKIRESLESRLLEQELAASKIKETLEFQLLEQQQAAAQTKQNLEGKLLVLQEAIKTNESLERALGEQQETAAKIKEGLERELQEQQEAAAKIAENQCQKQQEFAAKIKGLEEELSELQVTSCKNEDRQHELEDLRSQYTKLQDYSANLKTENASMLKEAKLNLEKKDTKMNDLEERLLTGESKVETLQQILQTQEEEMAKLRQESEAENRYRTLYEELCDKVRPFKEQLDAFEAEKNALLNEHGAAQEELNKLGDAYAKLLGHQNQKQKIKHVMKLKTENCQLRQEVSKLRCQLAKEKQTEKHLQEHLNDIKGIKRYDPSKAFQHDAKENIVPKVPLREGNRKKM